MNKLRLVNIRSFADSGLLRIAPLTLLVGENSSGKSTFARVFPLLRQTAEVLAREPLLWVGRFTDFGSAEEAVSKVSQGDSFGVDFEFMVDHATLSHRRERLGAVTRRTRRGLTAVEVSVRYLQPIGAKQGYRLSIGFLGCQLTIEITGSMVSQLIINKTDYSELLEDKLYASTWSACFPGLIYKDGMHQEQGMFYKKILNYVREHTHKRSGVDRVELLTSALIFAPLDGMLDAVKGAYLGDSGWEKTTKGWNEDSQDFVELRNWIVGARVTEIISALSVSFRYQCAKIRYIAPTRASAERYYRRQGLALGEIDPQGQNVAMFLHGMSPTERQGFSSWMAAFFGHSVDTVSSTGHISMVIHGVDSERDKFSFNLADTGFGFSQMLPVLIQIWSLINGKGSALTSSALPPVRIIAIEQPELHLHPRLQSRFADLFIQAISAAKKNSVDLRIIVETHSEQIINRVGKRISRGQMKREDVSLVLFDKPSFERPTQVTATSYDEEGLVNNWPFGFFESSER